MVRLRSLFLYVFFLLGSAALHSQPLYTTYTDLNQQGALALAAEANLEAQKINKNVSVAVLNSPG